MNPILPVPDVEYHIFPSLFIVNANGNDSVFSLISSNASNSGKYFRILSLLMIVIQIFPSKSA